MINYHLSIIICNVANGKCDVAIINYHLSIIICNVANGKYDLDGILFTFFIISTLYKRVFFL